MTKVYKLKYNLPTFLEGDICVLDEKGDLWWQGNINPEVHKKERELHWRDKVCMYNAKTLEKFKILETYFEEIKDISKFWPFEGCGYYYVSDTGVESDIWEERLADYDRKSLGNCFLNKEDAERVWKKYETIAILNKLGVKMTTFQLNENGKGMITINFPSEYRLKLANNFRTFLEESDDRKY